MVTGILWRHRKRKTGVRGRSDNVIVSPPWMENGRKDIRTRIGLNDHCIPLFPLAYRGREPEAGKIRGQTFWEVR